MSPFETTVGFIAMAIVGLALLVVLIWFIASQAYGEHLQDSDRRLSHGRRR